MTTVSRKSRIKALAFRSIAITFSLAVSVIVCELVMQLVSVGYGSAPLESDPILHHRHPHQYRFVSHTPSDEYGGHTVYYDSDGCSADPDSRIPQSANSRFRVAFMGDSFTEAAQVPYHLSFVGRLKQASSDVTVRNYGVSSYSPILYLLQWRKTVSAFKPTHVVLQLYSNDIADDASYSAKAVYAENGDLNAIPGPSGDWLVKQARKSYLIRFIRKQYLKLTWMFKNRQENQQVVGNLVEENPELAEASGKYVRQLAKEVEKSGATFVLTVIPSKYRIINKIVHAETPQFSDKWHAWANQNEIGFIDLVDPFEKESGNGKAFFFELDIHFTADAHSVVAKAISDCFSELFPPKFGDRATDATEKQIFQ